MKDQRSVSGKARFNTTLYTLILAQIPALDFYASFAKKKKSLDERNMVR
jgi:hypothetical protein